MSPTPLHHGNLLFCFGELFPEKPVDGISHCWGVLWGGVGDGLEWATAFVDGGGGAAAVADVGAAAEGGAGGFFPKGHFDEIPDIRDSLPNQWFQNWFELLKFNIVGITIPTDDLNPVLVLQLKVLRNIVNNYGFLDVATQ